MNYTTAEYLKKEDHDLVLWKEYYAQFSMGCEPNGRTKNAMYEEIHKIIFMRFIRSEMQISRDTIQDEGFLSHVVHKCDIAKCTFKVQVVIMTEIKNQSDEDKNPIKESKVFLCHYAIRNTHFVNPKLLFDDHCIMKWLNNPNMNHKPFYYNYDRTQKKPKDENRHMQYDGDGEGGRDNLKFGRRKCPIIEIYFRKFWSTEKDHSQENWHDWLFEQLNELKKQVKGADSDRCLELGKDLIKPLCEFSQHKGQSKIYEDHKTDPSETLTITIDGTELLSKYDNKERTVEVQRYQPLLVDRFYLIYWYGFCQGMQAIQQKRIYDWNADAICKHNRILGKPERYLYSAKRNWLKTLEREYWKAIGTSTKDMIQTENFNAQIQQDLRNNWEYHDGNREKLAEEYVNVLKNVVEEVNTHDKAMHRKKLQLDKLNHEYNNMKAESKVLRRKKIETAKLSAHLKSNVDSILNPNDAEVFSRVNTAITRTTNHMKTNKKKGYTLFKTHLEKNLDALLPNRKRQWVYESRQVPTFSEVMTKKRDDKEKQNDIQDQEDEVNNQLDDLQDDENQINSKKKLKFSKMKPLQFRSKRKAWKEWDSTYQTSDENDSEGPQERLDVGSDFDSQGYPIKRQSQQILNPKIEQDELSQRDSKIEDVDERSSLTFKDQQNSQVQKNLKKSQPEADKINVQAQ